MNSGGGAFVTAIIFCYAKAPEAFEGFATTILKRQDGNTSMIP